MEQPAENPALPSLISDELASALKDYCSALTEIADDARCERSVSPQQVERAEDAKLRLENARTFFELCVCRRNRNVAPNRRHTH